MKRRTKIGPIPNLILFDEPFYFDDLLFEGVFSTYSIDTVVNSLKRHFGFADRFEDYVFKYKSAQGVYNIAVLLEKDWHNYSSLKEKIMHEMERGGWVKARETTEDNTTCLVFEALHPNDCFEESPNLKYVYHISPIKHREKILRIGLVPKAKNKIHEYNAKIHFLYMLPWSLKTFAYQLERTLTKDGHIENPVYCIYRIDLTKLPKGTKFYPDSQAENSCWTYDNIPPYAIEEYDTIDLTK